MLTPRWLHSCCTLGKKLYAIGGVGGRKVNFIEAIDASRWVECVKNDVKIDVKWQKTFGILD